MDSKVGLRNGIFYTVCIIVRLPVHCLCLSAKPLVWLPVCQKTWHTPTCLYVYLSDYLCLPVCLVYLYDYLWMPVCLFICLSLPACLSICLTISACLTD